MDWETLKAAARKGGYRVTDDGLMVTFTNPKNTLDQGTFYQDATRGALTALSAAQQWLAQRNIHVGIGVNQPWALDGWQANLLGEKGSMQQKRPKSRNVALRLFIPPLILIAGWIWIALALLHWSLSITLAGIVTGLFISLVITIIRRIRAHSQKN